VPPEKEEAYGLLYAAMMRLRETCEERKAGVKKLLAELDKLRERALREFSGTGSLSRRLSAYQRKEMGFIRVNNGGGRKPALSVPAEGGGAVPAGPVPAPFPAGGFPNRREAKAWELKILFIIDRLKKTLLQLELLELRCRELLASITKTLEAFSYGFKAAKRKIYPFMIFSRVRKSLRRCLGGAYYTPGDIRELEALGSLTANAAEIAETPVFFADTFTIQ
jgi:hypothetical protein